METEHVAGPGDEPRQVGEADGPVETGGPVVGEGTELGVPVPEEELDRAALGVDRRERLEPRPEASTWTCGGKFEAYDGGEKSLAPTEQIEQMEEEALAVYPQHERVVRAVAEAVRVLAPAAVGMVARPDGVAVEPIVTAYGQAIAGSEGDGYTVNVTVMVPAGLPPIPDEVPVVPPLEQREPLERW